MTHVSETEVLDYIDHRLSAQTERVIEAHCAECAQCRRSVEFNRALMRSAGVIEPAGLAVDFTERVMRHSHIPVRRARFSWLLENSANIVAMIFVLCILAIVAYAMSLPSTDSGAASDSSYARIYGFWRDASSTAVSSFIQHTSQTTQPLATDSGKILGNGFWIGAAVLVLLGFADKIRTRLKAMSVV